MAVEELRYLGVTDHHSPRKSTILNSIGLVLVVWDLLLGLPLSYGITLLAYKAVVRYVSYTRLAESLHPVGKHLLDLVLQDNGVIATRALYVLLNLGIILSWAVQLVEKDEERVREELMRQIMWWDQEIDRLETMLYDLEEKELQEQIQREFQQSLEAPKPSSVVGVAVGFEIGSRKDWESALRKKSHSRTPSVGVFPLKKSGISTRARS